MNDHREKIETMLAEVSEYVEVAQRIIDQMDLIGLDTLEQRVALRRLQQEAIAVAAAEQFSTSPSASVH